MVQPAAFAPSAQAAAKLILGKDKVVANARNSFFKVTFSLKVNLRSNVKEASLAESRIYRSISQFSIRGGFICCVESLEA